MQSIMETIIRKVTAADAGEIAAIYNRYVTDTTITFEVDTLTDEEMKCRIEDVSSHFPYYVCEQEGHVVGFCYAHLWKDRAAYGKTLETTIYLSPCCLHQGIGTMLMHKLMADCKALGFSALIACITAGNEASVQMHRALGFEQVSHFKRVGMKLGRVLDVVDYEFLL